MSAEPLAVLLPQETLYCDVCGFPPEYCLYGSRLSKCKASLQKAHPALFERIYGSSSTAPVPANDGVEEATAGVEQVKVSALDKEAAKKEAKAEAKEEKAEKKRLASKVTIKRIERNKRKHVTAIHGLDVFGIDLKKASKLFANRFATGASVSKNNQGEDEIVIQGDVAYDVEELIFDKSPKVADVLGGGVLIPEDNVVVVDEKKKK